jgi:hypothetical protein
MSLIYLQCKLSDSGGVIKATICTARNSPSKPNIYTLLQDKIWGRNAHRAIMNAKNPKRI